MCEANQKIMNFMNIYIVARECFYKEEVKLAISLKIIEQLSVKLTLPHILLVLSLACKL